MPALATRRTNEMAGPVERHPFLRSVVRPMYLVPGAKPAARMLARFAIQRLPLTLRNRQRVYNFFATDTVPDSDLSCIARVESQGSLRLSLNLHDDLSRIWYYWGYSGYEKGVTRLFRTLAQQKTCIFDAGANIGYFTLLAASLVEGRGEVHAFEPCPEVFQVLSTNNALNRFESLHINETALSDVDGQQQLFLPEDAAWTNASLIPGFTTQGTQMPVETVRFDTYCTRKNIRFVDLVKLDIEGGELKALLGMGSMLKAWHPDLICEVLPPHERDLNEFFSETPYKKFLVTDDGLQEARSMQANSEFRDYYLSCNPVSLT